LTYFDIWALGAFVSIMTWLFFDDFNTESKDGTQYSLSLYFTMYMLIGLFSWFSFAVILGAKNREEKEKEKEKDE